MKPGDDYDFVWTGGHAQSIKQIQNNLADAAAVASDLLDEIMTDSQNPIKAEDFRTIYKSHDFPKAAFGVSCRLKPDLAANIRKAFLTFDFKGTKLEEVLRGSKSVKFVEVDYKKDWASVREVDEKLMKW